MNFIRAFIEIGGEQIGFLIRKLIFAKIKQDSPEYAFGKLHHSRNCDSYAHHILHPYPHRQRGRSYRGLQHSEQRGKGEI